MRYGTCLHSFPRLLISKNPKPYGLNNRNVLSHYSGGQNQDVCSRPMPWLMARRKSFLASSSFCYVPAIFDVSWLVDVSVTPVTWPSSPCVSSSSYMFVIILQISHFYKGHQSYQIKAHPNHLILT